MRAAAVLFERDERSSAQAAQAVQVGPAQLPAARVSKSFQNLLTDAELAHYAVTALIDEAELTPKPARLGPCDHAPLGASARTDV
jgi:triphosphoribosyl-dephospho-CoA synthase